MTDGLSRRGPDIDILEGRAREDAFAYILFRARVEHKRDHLAAETGNLAVEYETSEYENGGGRRWPSGIATSEAEWWAFEYLPDSRLVEPRDRVKKLAREAIRRGRHAWGGDHNRFHSALVPLEWFVPIVDRKGAQLEEAA